MSANCLKQTSSLVRYLNPCIISLCRPAQLLPSQMISIPRLSQRLDCMLYRRKLEIEIEEIRPELNIVRNASRELRSSVRFKTILQVNRAMVMKCQQIDILL